MGHALARNSCAVKNRGDSGERPGDYLARHSLEAIARSL